MYCLMGLLPLWHDYEYIYIPGLPILRKCGVLHMHCSTSIFVHLDLHAAVLSNCSMM